ncbi:MAG: Uma2 family endonuclease [Desulfobacterales bacterium]|nr:Uma2 family endonuclease [Desulfobacterales bacterium]
MDALQTLSPDDQIRQETFRDISPAENNVPKDGLAVSEKEYWEKYYHDPDFVYEWNNGYLEVKPMSDQKGSETYQWFCDIMRCYIRTYPVGRTTNLEIGFRLALPHKTSARIPDLAVVLDNNPVRINDDDCSYSGIFDLCVESLSHSSLKEVRRDTVDKKSEYSTGGVREYYILDARGTETAFYTLNSRGGYDSITPVNGDIIRSRILPGFQFRISDLYTRPSLEELAEDEIYHDYVFPSHKVVKEQAEKEKKRAEEAENLLSLEKYRAEKAEKQLILEKQRAEQEKQRAEQEKQRAGQEKQRAERLAEKLRSLGISPEEI